MRATVLSVVFVAALAADAIAAERRPAWIDGSSVMYPSEKYLTGMGQGEDRATAENRARAAVASVFSTRVSSTTLVGASERSAGDRVETSQSVDQQIRTATDRVVEGVEIAETWRDPARGDYYALAVVNRYKAADALQQKIDEIENTAKALLKRLTAEQRFDRARAGGGIMAAGRRRDAAVADLRILLPARAAGSAMDWTAARAAAAKALRELKVSVAAQGAKGAAAIAAAITSAVADFGMGARTGGDEGGDDLVIAATVTLSGPAKPDHGWHWRSAKVAVTVTDAHESRTVTAFETSAREAASSAEVATERVLKSAGKKAGAELNAALAKYFE